MTILAGVLKKGSGGVFPEYVFYVLTTQQGGEIRGSWYWGLCQGENDLIWWRQGDRIRDEKAMEIVVRTSERAAAGKGRSACRVEDSRAGFQVLANGALSK